MTNQSAAIDVDSPDWDEDSALVVMTWDGANAWLDWYSLKDGARHAGALQAMSTFSNMYWQAPGPLIGGAGTTSTAGPIGPSQGYWPGEIAALGHVLGDVPVAGWQAVARSADPIATLGAANLRYYRRFDGSGDGYGPPAGASADASAACVPVDGANLRPGSDFWLGSSGLGFDPIPTRYVYGLLAGETSKAVTFEGRATAAHEGASVEVQVFNAATGMVEKDWTSVGTVTAGVWSGAVTVPKSSQGWICARARVASAPTVIAWMFEPFAVGWKFAVFGQSQMQIAAMTDAYDGTPDGPVLASAGIRDDLANDPWLELVRIRTDSIGDANVAFRRQFDMYGDSTPVMLCWYTESGTSAIHMIDDSGPDSREWSNVVMNHGVWGTDITAVLWNWGTSDLGTDWSDLYDAVFDGTGVLAKDHAFADIFPAGFGRILSPLTRAVTTSAGPLSSDGSPQYKGREEQLAYAEANGWTVGPYVYMQVATDAAGHGVGGPHQGVEFRGNPLVGNRLAIAAARHVGLDTSTNPRLTGTATFDAAKTTITVPVTLPNGGTLTAAAPSAITGFEVNDGGAGSYSRLGFAAAISGSDIVLTKDSGAWLSGTKLRFMCGGPLSYGTAGPTEDVLLDGVPHETYALDEKGWGLPLDGMGAVAITVT